MNPNPSADEIDAFLKRLREWRDTSDARDARDEARASCHEFQHGQHIDSLPVEPRLEPAKHQISRVRSS